MTFITLFVLFLVSLFASLYVFRHRLIAFMSASITAIMVLSGVAVILGLFVPALFTLGASQTLERAGTLESLRKADGTLSFSNVTTAASTAWDTVIGWFGQKPTPTPQPKEAQKGVLEQNVYPELVNALAGIYRVLTIIIGLALMGISVYLSYATGSVAETVSLAQRVAYLESKLAEQENS